MLSTLSSIGSLSLKKKVYFYPHSYLRDRQLDTIRYLYRGLAVNSDFANKCGSHVPAEKANKSTFSLKQVLPLLNLKFRPRECPKDSILYIWGGIPLRGDFIVDIDNPWCFVGYNTKAMLFYKPIIRFFLNSDRCKEILCMSEACRQSLRVLFGERIYKKSSLSYPVLPFKREMKKAHKSSRNFLFVSSQFEIKGGKALIRAFDIVSQKFKDASLTIVSHLSADEVEKIKNSRINVVSSMLSRDELFALMQECDVLVHPSYMDSFGMVVLESLCAGMAVITTDMYALPEMVDHGKNGYLIRSDLSSWNKYIPSRYFSVAALYKALETHNCEEFSNDLAVAMANSIRSLSNLKKMQKASTDMYQNIFMRNVL